MTATTMAEPVSPKLLEVRERAKRDPQGRMLSLLVQWCVHTAIPLAESVGSLPCVIRCIRCLGVGRF
jgi:hypothetical protein